MKKYLNLALIALMALVPSFASAALPPAVQAALTAYENAPAADKAAAKQNLVDSIEAELQSSTDVVASLEALATDLLQASSDADALQVSDAIGTAAASVTTDANRAAVITALSNSVAAAGKGSSSVMIAAVSGTGGGSQNNPAGPQKLINPPVTETNSGVSQG